MSDVLHQIQQAISCNLRIVIAFAISFVIGIIAGCFYFQDEVNIVIINISVNKFYITDFGLETSAFSVFLSRIFSSIAFLIILTMLSLTVYTYPLQTVVFAFRGMELIVTAIILVNHFSIVGLFIFLFILLPSGLIITLSLLVLSTLNYQIISNCNNCGVANSYLTNFIIALIVSLVGCLYEFILLGLFLF